MELFRLGIRVLALGVVMSLAAALGAFQAAPPPEPLSVDHLQYRGAFVLPAADDIGKGAGLAYAPSRGTWFVVDRRAFNFGILEIHMPDDAAARGGAHQPAAAQASAPRATLVRRWGTVLASPAGGPIDPKQDDVFGAYWDDATQRLYVSYADFYGEPATNDCLVALDFKVNPPAVRGPWRFGHGKTEFSQRWGFSQFVRAPKTIADAAGSQLTFLASGRRNNTFQSGSWGPGLLVASEPAADTAPHAIVDARQVMFWPSIKTKVTLDSGKVKTAFMTSAMLRRDPISIISGNSTNFLGGPPEWRDVPYGRATLQNGWANGDDAGHFVAVDEKDVQGVAFFGSYTVGAEWYGPPLEFADDRTADQKSPTGFRSWALVRSTVFPPDPQMNPGGYVYDHQGGGKGNRQEALVPAAWFYTMSDLVAALTGKYKPRQGLTALNVDAASFAVLATPFAAPDLHPAFRGLQYDDRTNAYSHDAPSHIIKVTGAYFRPTGVAGVARRLYVRTNSNLGAGTDVVNVFDLK
jgi:hypothetical protein